jgi:hypothetical protein
MTTLRDVLLGLLVAALFLVWDALSRRRIR